MVSQYQFSIPSGGEHKAYARQYFDSSHRGQDEDCEFVFQDLCVYLGLTHQIDPNGLRLVKGQKFETFIFPDKDDIREEWSLSFLIKPEEGSSLDDLHLDYSYGDQGPNSEIPVIFNPSETLEGFCERVLDSVGSIKISVVSGEHPLNKELLRIVADVSIFDQITRFVIWEEGDYGLEPWEVFSHIRKYFPNIKKLYPEECTQMQNREKKLRLRRGKEKHKK